MIFAWKGSKDNHLALVHGETLLVLQQSEKWWSGEYQGKVGWFPKTFVKLLDTPSSTSQDTAEAAPTPQAAPTVPPTPSVKPAKSELYVAIYDYVGDAGDLPFLAGDVIEVSELSGTTGT